MPFTLIGLSFQHQIDINLIAVPLASKKTVAHTNARVGMTQSFSRLVLIKAAKNKKKRYRDAELYFQIIISRQNNRDNLYGHEFTIRIIDKTYRNTQE
ncbi:Uncharacterized protein APZ42_018596, partial [Daphnia magna]